MFKFRKILLIIFLACSFCSFDLVAIGQQDSNVWINVKKNNEKAVIQIFADVAPFDYSKPHIEPAFTQHARGSGFFINDQGYILTNFHVIGSGQECVLRMQHPALGKDRFELEIVGCHRDRDFAVLKLKEDNFKVFKDSLKDVLGSSEIPYLNLGESNSLETGTNLMTMGYPLGHENLKISTGNMSGNQTIGGQYLIQTEAAVNPGNSGGPFLDESGNVVGIVVSNFPEAQNIGFFIPISGIDKMVEGFVNSSYSTKLLKDPFWGGRLSFSCKDTLDYLGCPTDGGIYVAKVLDRSLFQRNGIKEGDIIYKANDTLIDRYGYVTVEWCQNKVRLFDMLDRLNIGDRIDFIVYRDKKPLDISFVVDIEENLAIGVEHPKFKKPEYFSVGGMVVMELTLNHLVELKNLIKETVCKYGQLQLPDVLQYDEPENRKESKIVIAHIVPGSVIDGLRCFQAYDILNEINGIEVRSLQDFKDAVILAQDCEYLNIKAEDGSFAAISMSKILT